MSGLAPEPGRRRSGLLLAMALVVLVAIGAGVIWALSDRAGPNPRTAAAPPSPPAQNAPSTIAQNSPPPTASDEITKSLDELRQQVTRLDTASQDLSQQLETAKRELSETQGDVKLLSQQVGALSERLESAAASKASMPNAAEASQKKRAKSR